MQRMVFAKGRKESTSKTEVEIHVCETHSQRKQKKSLSNKIQLIPDSHVKTYRFAD